MIQINPTHEGPVHPALPIFVSIGIMARNEADSIHHTIASLFAQSVFREMAAHGSCLEITCVVNGSTDGTAEVVKNLFAEASQNHPQRNHFKARVHTVQESGKPNACNQFIHACSGKEARYLVLMDADIIFVHQTAIWKLLEGLEDNKYAMVTVGTPLKSLDPDKSLTLREKLSLATSRMTQSAPGQLTGQLYCIRTGTARHIHFPRALPSCDDGYVKSLVCTNFGQTQLQNNRIRTVPHAAHKFDPYLPFSHILMNQKRQMMGQTFLHVLLDQFIPGLQPAERADLGRVIRHLEENQPSWLAGLMSQHLLATRYFWRLFPGFLTFRFQRLKAFPLRQRIQFLPATLAGFLVTLIAGWLAARSLRQGNSHYWPELRRPKNCPDHQTTPSP
ncbi:MAG: glycosyltransferase [Opitutales bacterium]|nr:glycosyltransferase [Opitutales bacterium]